MYFCDEEHYFAYVSEIEKVEKEKEQKRELRKKIVEQAKQEEKEAKMAFAAKKKEEKEAKERERIEKYKEDKNKVYYTLCEIINRKEIINTMLWKEWALWNKVASNEVIGQYLEENKNYLINVVGNVDNVEFLRIRYLSAIIKNNIGDYKPNTKETVKPKVAVDETFYTPTTNGVNKRRSLADLEDDL